MPHIAADSSGVTGTVLGTTLRLVTIINMHCPVFTTSGIRGNKILNAGKSAH